MCILAGKYTKYGCNYVDTGTVVGSELLVQYLFPKLYTIVLPCLGCCNFFFHLFLGFKMAFIVFVDKRQTQNSTFTEKEWMTNSPGCSVLPPGLHPLIERTSTRYLDITTIMIITCTPTPNRHWPGHQRRKQTLFSSPKKTEEHWDSYACLNRL